MDNQQVSISEIYKVYPEYPTLEISNQGNVRYAENKRSKYLGVNAQGYKYFQIRVCGKLVTLKVHRLVAELFLEPPSKELVEKCSKEHWGKVLVKHLDNDKSNNSVSNLEWSDLKGNTRQAWDDGLIKGRKGSSNGRSVLNEDTVHKICKAFEDGMQPKEAVEVFGISRAQATKIRAGFAWKQISCLYNIDVNKRDKTSTTIETTV